MPQCPANPPITRFTVGRALTRPSPVSLLVNSSPRSPRVTLPYCSCCSWTCGVGGVTVVHGGRGGVQGGVVPGLLLPCLLYTALPSPGYTDLPPSSSWCTSDRCIDAIVWEDTACQRLVDSLPGRAGLADFPAQSCLLSSRLLRGSEGGVKTDRERCLDRYRSK